jgi:hypothetical protein
VVHPVRRSDTLPNGRELVTLEDAANYVIKLPKAETKLGDLADSGGKSDTRCRDRQRLAYAGADRNAPGIERRQAETGCCATNEESQGLQDRLIVVRPSSGMSVTRSYGLKLKLTSRSSVMVMTCARVVL